jgi:hypothetical protein
VEEQTYGAASLHVLCGDGKHGREIQEKHRVERNDVQGAIYERCCSAAHPVTPL